MENVYHRLELPQQFGLHIGLLLVERNMMKVCPSYKIVPTGWPHLVTTTMVIAKVILQNEAHLDPVKGNTADVAVNIGPCGFAAYIDYMFLLGTYR